MQRHLSDTCGTFSGSVWGVEILGNKEKSGCYLQGCRKSRELPETTRRAVLTSPAGWSPHLGPGPGVREFCVNRRIWRGCLVVARAVEMRGNWEMILPALIWLFCGCHLNIKRGQGWPSWGRGCLSAEIWRNSLYFVSGRFSHVRFFVTPWRVSQQAPLSVGFSRQEHWSGLACPPPGDLPSPGFGPASLMSSALAGGFFTTGTSLRRGMAATDCLPK